MFSRGVNDEEFLGEVQDQRSRALLARFLYFVRHTTRERAETSVASQAAPADDDAVTEEKQFYAAVRSALFVHDALNPSLRVTQSNEATMLELDELKLKGADAPRKERVGRSGILMANEMAITRIHYSVDLTLLSLLDADIEKLREVESEVQASVTNIARAMAVVEEDPRKIAEGISKIMNEKMESIDGLRGRADRIGSLLPALHMGTRARSEVAERLNVVRTSISETQQVLREAVSMTGPVLVAYRQERSRHVVDRLTFAIGLFAAVLGAPTFVASIYGANVRPIIDQPPVGEMVFWMTAVAATSLWFLLGVVAVSSGSGASKTKSRRNLWCFCASFVIGAVVGLVSLTKGYFPGTAVLIGALVALAVLSVGARWRPPDPDKQA